MIKTERWYSPAQVAGRFAYPQVIFVLNNWPSITEGVWPPRATGYGKTGEYLPVKSPDMFYSPVTDHHRSTSAPFEGALQVAAELQARLKLCGVDGKMVTLSATGWTYDQIYNKYRQNGARRWQISGRIHHAIDYCCGTARQTLPYEPFIEIVRRTWRENKQRQRGYQIHVPPVLTQPIDDKPSLV